ncbi:MAG: hypothetical protein OHK0053_23820 [Microscillaceae bacterium]
MSGLLFTLRLGLLIFPGLALAQDLITPLETCPQVEVPFAAPADPEALRYVWDFCTGDLQLSPTAQRITDFINDPNTSGNDAWGPEGLEIVYDDVNQEWFGFITNVSSGSLLRIEFGTSLASANPGYFLVQNVFPSFWNDEPTKIRIAKSNGNWFAFIENNGAGGFSGNGRIGGSVIRFNFGNNLRNFPTASILVTGDNSPFKNQAQVVFSRFDFPQGFEIVKDGNDIKMVIVDYPRASNGSFPFTRYTVFNFNDNLASAPTFVQTQFAVFNSWGLSLIQEGNNWYGIILSETAGRNLQKLSFGSSLENTPTLANLGASLNINDGREVKIKQDGKNFIAIGLGTSGRIYRFDFGNSLSDNQVTFTNLGNYGILGTLNLANRPSIAATLQVDQSNWYFFAINRHPNQDPPFNDNELIRVDFPNLCNASTDVASEASGNIRFLRQAAGRNYINLRTFDANGNPGRVYTDSIEVIDAVTGAFTISNFANCPDGLVQALGNLGDCFGQSIQFNNLSPGFTTGAPYFNTLLWDFGDGQTSTLQNPLHTYAAPGEYEVKLTINNASNSCNNTLRQTVKIRSAPPQVNFTIRRLDCETGKVVFEDLSQVPAVDAALGSILTRRTWVFGDGLSFEAGRNDIASLGLDPSFKYNNWIVRGPKTSEEINNIEVQAQNLPAFEPGQRYTVSLSTNNEVCCGASTSQVISLDPADTQPNFSFNNACAGAPTSFEDLSQLAAAVSGDIDQWEWTFFDTDGTTLLGTSTLQNPVFTFANPGTYPVRLVARGTFACPQELTQNVSVLPNALSAFAVINEPGTSPINGFAPLTLSFSNLSQNATEYEWDFGDGQISTEPTPSHTFQLPTGQDQASFEVILKAFNANGCVSLSSRQVNIVGNPNALTSSEDLGILIAPNPFEQVLRLMPASAPIPRLEVQITDMLGREIYRQGFSQFSQAQTLELGHLPAGLYLLRLDTGGKKAQTKILRR